MTHFDTAIKKLLKHEGGFVDHPSDPGGATNFGISLRWYRRHINSTAGPEVIRELTKEMAEDLYLEYFWRPEYDTFERRLAIKVFDLSVNMGPAKSHMLLQRALKSVGNPVETDGQLGPKTSMAVHKSSPAILLAALRSEAAGRYRVLVAHNPKFKAFIKGWLKRAYA